MFDLTGKTALVTGASRGIGRAIALALAAQGADVALHFNARADAARAVAADIEAMGQRAVILGADARDFAAFSEVWARAETELGPLDILVNNAGLLQPAFLGLMSESTWDESLDVNLKSAFAFCPKKPRARCSGASVGASSMSPVKPGKPAKRWARITAPPKPV